ncbi:fumarylacetoacetate hydrolase family protein [Sulfurisphaera ohwakuensis]|uniref:2-keto-4-pentenoate hydratase/2-oxohepta-3-ene-1,7-dioic acid hydratase in catechol pathway n=1 Tax=Sulfurisphaera ohwakuensis TaxID=69656 RepID=A0A650CHY0_SULOH|nr:fumarylacetoacetate hydrolase family protein [Sulfurisphaera ohwakuensis]MBB5253560.1 2-keto-4-pentenoate hydratase/2-oxohepta-3-ene-1,7-dioic acid hydratase in catechol pathway [Sulfurisphaera ohwakuensis]QGR17420.1 FAA hydrolase family protein [Sulfurisphaera ohwakuensis]
MKIGFAITENGEKKVVFIENEKYYEIKKDGLDCVVSNPISFIKAYDVMVNLPKTEIKIKKLLPPLFPNKIFLPAVNFRSHSSETSMTPPKSPYFFTKFSSNSVVGPEDYIIIPRDLKRVDYEGEIGIIIGRRGKYIKKEEAMDYVFGYTIVNDVSFRDYQFPELHPYGLNWVMGKALDTGLPIGPWIVTKDEIKDFKLRIITKLNGQVVQDGNTEDMIFSVEDLISYLSQGITLEPGDVITTGTPAGVAEFTGKKYLEDGDAIEVEVEKIGVLRNYVKKES